MNKTEHYNLNQWELHDRVMMQDFNADNAKLDAALKAEADARAAETAAREAAVAVLNTQLGKRGNCRVETWSYTGNGKYGANNPNRITFSGVPKLVVIQGSDSIAFFVGSLSQGHRIGMTPSNSGLERTSILCTWTGNAIQFHGDSAMRQMNESPHTYQVVAFLAAD